jgi:four helix bundle protein
MTKVPAQRFEDLVMWQKSHALVLRVYRETSSFPNHKLYGLVSQMRRAAVSVPANIAESFKKRKNPEKARVMNIAQASLEELRCYTLLARDLSYLPSGSRWGEVEDIARMLGAYVATLLAATDD